MTNSCHFIGNLGSDPKINTFGNGDKQATFSIGQTDKWRDKNGERKELTTWVNIVVSGGLVGICEQYLRKGSKIYVEGKFRNRSYEKDGITRYLTEIRANNIQMLDSPSGGERSSDYENAGFSGSSRDVGEQSQTSSNNDLDDEIPFN